MTIKLCSFTTHNYCMYPTDGSTMKSYAGYQITVMHINEKVTTNTNNITVTNARKRIKNE